MSSPAGAQQKERLPMTTSDEMPDGWGAMTTAQRGRAGCLRSARDVLPEAGTESDAVDLVNVASWVETGRDPWVGRMVDNGND